LSPRTSKLGNEKRVVHEKELAHSRATEPRPIMCQEY
jgi:hypothetical protein